MHHMHQVIQIPIVCPIGSTKPKLATSGAAGHDLVSPISFWLFPKCTRVVDILVRFAIPSGVEGQIRTRSGMAIDRGLTISQGVGTIDSDHRGSVGVPLYNIGWLPRRIKAGDRIAQIVFSYVPSVRLDVKEHLSITRRGDCGRGSTGR